MDKVNVFSRRAPAENGRHGAQIAVAVADVGQQVRTLGVLVPRIYENGSGLLRIRERESLRLCQNLPEYVGGVVDIKPAVRIFRPFGPRQFYVVAAAHRGIPAHRRYRNVGQRGFRHISPVPFVGGHGVGGVVENSVYRLFLEKIPVVCVYPVPRGALKSGGFHNFGLRRASDHGVPVDGRQAVFAHGADSGVEEFLHVLRAPVALYEIRSVVYRKKRAAADLVIVGLFKIMLYAIVERGEEIFRSALELHKNFARSRRVGPESVYPVVVGPHYCELHFVPIGSLQKPLFERLLHRALSAVPVPVVQEHRYAGVRCKVDFLGDIGGILAVEVSGYRAVRKFVPLEARLARLYELPFRPAFPEPLFPVGIDVPMRIVDAQNVEPAFGGAALGSAGRRRKKARGEEKKRDKNRRYGKIFRSH